MSASIAEQAEGQKSGFCFSENTYIFVENTDGNKVKRKVSEIQLGDKLAFNSGKVTAVIVMDGKNVPLYW